MLLTGIPDSFDETRRKQISDRTIKDAKDKVAEINGIMGDLRKDKHFN